MPGTAWNAKTCQADEQTLLPTIMNGVLIIDKPAGLTSHDVVNRVRRLLGQRSVGHLGTLDPMATGVLPLVLGNLTRLAQFYRHSEKTYEGCIRFGFATDTYDAEGEPASASQAVSLNPDEVRAVASRFRGIIEQIPPPFSAKKIQGVPAYKLARKQKEVVLKPVKVEVKEFEILGLENERAEFRARVASGTYMRSIAHEMGRELGCGAHLESLRRTAVAEFLLGDAHTLDEIAARVELNLRCEETAGASRSTFVEEFLVHPRKLLPQMPAVMADEAALARIRTGRTVNLPELSQARLVKVFEGQRELVAIATRVAGTLFHPGMVLCEDRSAHPASVR
jgi:tRNA pseudouridine55 synthase